MRYYKLNNQYLTYDTLHNEYGYTRTPTEEVRWLSTGDHTHNWGDYVCDGYTYLPQDFTQCTNFAESIIGWNNLNTIAKDHSLYPSTSNTLILVRNGVLSLVASLSFSDEPRYLIKEDLSQGWMTEQEYTERGWSSSNIFISGIVTPTDDIKEEIQDLEEVEVFEASTNLSLGFIPNTTSLSMYSSYIHLPLNSVPDSGVVDEYIISI